MNPSVAQAGSPASCQSQPTAELTLSCLEQLHPELKQGSACDPAVWLGVEPFLPGLANALYASKASNAQTERLACAFGSWKYEQLWWQTSQFGKESPEMFYYRNRERYANDEEAFRSLFNVGQHVFAVNNWPPYFRYARQFCPPDWADVGKCW